MRIYQKIIKNYANMNVIMSLCIDEVGILADAGFFCLTDCILCLTLCHTCTPVGKGLCDREWDKVRIGKTINDGYLFIYRGIRGLP